MFINFSEKGSYHEKQYSVSSVLRNRKKKKIMQDSERKMLKNRAHCLTTPPNPHQCSRLALTSAFFPSCLPGFSPYFYPFNPLLFASPSRNSTSPMKCVWARVPKASSVGHDSPSCFLRVGHHGQRSLKYASYKHRLLLDLYNL